MDSPDSYRIKTEPVGPKEIWVVHHKEGDQSRMMGNDHAEKWASDHSDTAIRYIRADLAGEQK